MRPYDAVVLDAGGVLLVPDPDALRELVAPFGIVPDDATCHRAHYEGMHELDRMQPADYPAADRFLARWLGVSPADLDAAAAAISELYIQRPFVPVADAAASLQRLQEAGYPLAIVSNAAGTMEAQLANHRICSTDGRESVAVAIVVDSEVVGVEKPDPRIFRFALDALGLAAERCLYVGDSTYFDVGGATAAGLHPLHLDPYGLCDDPAAHSHARSLSDLADELVAAARR